MSDNSRADSNTVHYRAVAPSGVAPEVEAGHGISIIAAAAVGQWLLENIPEESRASVAGMSGTDIAYFDQLLHGQESIPVDVNLLQRIASALIILKLTPDVEGLWTAAGLNETDYIVAPSQIVKELSGNS